MLDLMRAANRRKWFVWTVILFVVMSFVIAIFAIWGGAATGGATAGGQTWVARVGDTTVSAQDFERNRQQVEAYYRERLGDQFDSIASQLNFDQIALSQLLGQALAYTEAARLGLVPGEQEVADAIVNAPIFQRNGRFIGQEQYLYELRGRGYDVEQYERQVARELAVDKLHELVGTMASASDAEVEKAFAEKGQTAEVEYVVFKEADFKTASEPTPREIEAHHGSHRSDYMTAEKRNAAYVLIEREPLVRFVEIPEAEIQKKYDKDKDSRYSTPDQRRASHILVKVPEGAAPLEVEVQRAKAESLLAQVRSGGDFAQIARDNSEDVSSATQGGDLDWFGRGRMVPEFEQSVFSLNEGQVSDLVRSQFGFHIIKLTGIRAAGTRPLEEVRDQIRQQLGFGKAQELLTKKSDELSARLAQQASSFEGTAAELGYTVKQTGPIAKGEALGEMGPVPQASEEIFRLKMSETSGPIATPRGVMFARVIDILQPELAPLDTVRERVKSDLLASRTRAAARAAALQVASAGADGFKTAADKAKVEVKSTGQMTRSSAPSAFNDEVKNAIFSSRAGEVKGPLDAPEGVVVVKVLKRGPEGPEEIAQLKATLRSEILERKKEDAFGALLQRLQKATPPEINPEVMESLSRRAAR